VQDGKRNLFQTVIAVEKNNDRIIVTKDKDNTDKLNYLVDKKLDVINNVAMNATAVAHNNGGIPNIMITIKNFSPETFGYMTYFFMKACAISGYNQGLNPFDQPGVEAYKKEMFAQLKQK